MMAMAAEPITDEDIIYIAAIIDVLGNIRSYEAENHTMLAHISISSSKPALVNMMARATGVKPVPMERAYQRYGCNIHCPDQHIHSVSRNSVWKVTGWKATAVLAAIIPYLRLQQQVAKDVYAIGMAAEHKPASVKKMIELGWPEVEEIRA